MIVFSDPHYHDWKSFSDVKSGMNSRLLQTLKASKDCFGYALKKDKIVLFGGDMFHTRGVLTPSVFNPVKKLIDEYAQKGVRFVMIAGNHDSETLNAETGKTSLDSLSGENIIVVSSGYKKIEIDGNVIHAIAWIDNLDVLKKTIEEVKKDMSDKDILLMHTAVDGILDKMGQGLDPEYLYNLPCALVLYGHIHKHHNYKNKVYSIGSLTQQTFGDMNDDRGYLVINDSLKVNLEVSNAPKFVNINKVEDSLTYKQVVRGNFVKCVLENVSEDKKPKIRELLESMKPLKLDLRFNDKIISKREGGETAASVSTKEITNNFIKNQGFDYKKETKDMALKILSELGV